VDPRAGGPGTLDPASEEVLQRLRALRARDLPTHGGRVLSYVYDPGLAGLDELAAEAMRIVQPVNGLDPTAFPSVAALERGLVGFAREVLHGDEAVTGSVTSGGTESCMLAVRTARDLWRRHYAGARPRLIAPVTAHAAFHKAAHCFDLQLDLVPVDADTGAVAAAALVDRLGPDVALVAVSAPAYPYGALDPIAEVAAAAADRGIACHVDACIGGWVLPWWGDADHPLAPWDFRVPGITSLSADLHKYGYAPKGVSLLLHRGRDRHRAQYFATRRWPGYPVVNPTLLGSRSAGALAAAWAIVQRLGHDGFAALAARTRRATDALAAALRAIPGLRIVGAPDGPLLALAADRSLPASARVDPHHWVDRVRSRGWHLQQQPGLRQADGTRLPPTVHLTVTPVTEAALPELLPALREAADEVRGRPPADPAPVLAALAPVLPAPSVAPPGAGAAAPIPAPGGEGGGLDPAGAGAVLEALGLGGPQAHLPAETAPLMGLIEALPAGMVESLLVELLARLAEPPPAPGPILPSN
jgi:glutamate/tyrosine decarboxylase-like PLP-dependent enzyme